ncbi:3-hydroxyacyl-[acyl-carrier-protein] dehydratase [Arboricoccus pini]|uniref:3-hydroxyacyl-[acyl-carrier-protein] dehydratase FabZ n=1 Tax=Arboricoccus pini TaxID=1963835 RepID=A0A212R7H2_9PROT|nr:3-hydroxyacyl-ACP dehydratase FabZ [Arboricoccus pini]SNB67973.1 3-hydroxyacyl-[acyl-carrier-protein] dehydratase [Arboricoccus pini]
MTDKTPLPHGTRLPDVGYAEILAILPHRYPMLLLDRLVDARAFESAAGIKNVTFNEPFFMGHFPGDPIMPGVMIIEAMAQAAAVLAIRSLGEWANGSGVYFMGVDGAKFRRPVRPGDQLRLEVTLDRHRLGVWKYAGRATVEGSVAAEAVLTAKLMPPS